MGGPDAIERFLEWIPPSDGPSEEQPDGDIDLEGDDAEDDE